MFLMLKIHRVRQKKFLFSLNTHVIQDIPFISRFERSTRYSKNNNYKHIDNCQWCNFIWTPSNAFFEQQYLRIFLIPLDKSNIESAEDVNIGKTLFLKSKIVSFLRQNIFTPYVKRFSVKYSTFQDAVLVSSK